jgi:hypothetical protein
MALKRISVLGVSGRKMTELTMKRQMVALVEVDRI